jgi:integrase
MRKTLEYQKLNGLFVFCKKCRSDVNGKSKTAKSCSHPIESQSYKAVVRIPNSGYDRKTKILIARNFEDAVLEFVDFKKQVKNPFVNSIKAIKPTKTNLLVELMTKYLDFMNDEKVPHHMKKYLTQSHIKITTVFLQDFAKFLRTNGFNLKKIELKTITDSVVGKYCEFLESKGYSNYTFNAKVKALRTFYNYLIEKEDYVIKNVWKKVKLKSEKGADESISSEDFYGLLEVINETDSFDQIGKTRRNMYKPWIKDLIKLKAFTGRRNAELFAMKWNMIHFEVGRPIFIQSPNIKINRQQNNFDEKDFQFAFVPVAEELSELLDELGLQHNIGSSDYIIAPDVQTNRKYHEEFASKSFTFFFKRLKRSYSRQLKHFRKTYITQEDSFINRRISMQHSNYQTTSKHYIDRKEIAKDMVKQGFRIFPKQSIDSELMKIEMN